MPLLRRALSTLTAVTVGALSATAFAAPTQAAPVAPAPAEATGTNIVENFDTVPAPGWTTINNSAPAGTLTPWFQGTHTTATPTPGPFNAHEGAANAYAAANFNATTGGNGTISGWMITPPIADLSAGDAWSFYTRKPTVGQGMTDYPDRLEVRVSLEGSCNPGTTATSVGDFTTLLLTVNPNLATGAYPQSWTQFSGTIPDGAPASGCLAFRYFVTGGGPTGANSDYIGVDTFRYTHGPDPIVPDTTLTMDGAPGTTVNATFAGTPDYAVTGYECSLDGAAFATCTSPATMTDLSQGSHTFSVRAKTAAGTTDPTPASQTFIVDTVKPVANFDSAPSGTLATTSVTATFSADDPDATFECKLDDGDWATCTSPASFTDLADGEHTLAVRSTDQQANIGDPASTAFTVDTTAPVTSLTETPASTVATNTVSVAFTSDDTDATHECKLNDGDWATCTSPASFTNLTDGDHTVAVRATDAVGNIGEAASTSFTVALPAPPATQPTQKLTKVTLKAPKKAKSAKKVKITVTGLTPGAKVTVKLGKKKKTFTVTKTAKATTKVTFKLKAPKTRKTRKYTLSATATLGTQKATTTKKIKVRARR